jgi:hypothetical protein
LHRRHPAPPDARPTSHVPTPNEATARIPRGSWFLLRRPVLRDLGGDRRAKTARPEPRARRRRARQIRRLGARPPTAAVSQRTRTEPARSRYGDLGPTRRARGWTSRGCERPFFETAGLTPRRSGPPTDAQVHGLRSHRHSCREGPVVGRKMGDGMGNLGTDLTRYACDQDLRVPPGGFEPPLTRFRKPLTAVSSDLLRSCLTCSASVLVALGHLLHRRLPCLGWANGWATRTPAPSRRRASAPNSIGPRNELSFTSTMVSTRPIGPTPVSPALAATASKEIRR